MPRALIASLILVAGNATAIDIPVDSLEGWTSLAYQRIPQNQVSVVDGALKIAVNKSAGPLIYKLDAPTLLAGITVTARWAGELKLPAGSVQGSKGVDDFVLRVGVVEAGDQPLNWMQRQFAPDWLSRLVKLAPQGSGVKRVDFFSTTLQGGLVGKSRTHPLSDLLRENWLTHLQGPGTFKLSHAFSQPVEVLALWVSTDGDDTGSRFDVVIDSITLQTAR